MSELRAPTTFVESLAAGERQRIWLAYQTITLTLPTLEGAYTAHRVWFCPQTQTFAHNVAAYGGWENAAP